MTALSFAYNTTSGRVLWSHTSSAAGDVSHIEGVEYIVAPEGAVDDPNRYVVANGQLVDRTIAPPTLVELSAARKLAAVTVYEGLITAGYTHGGVLFQIDAESQTQLAAMSLMALGTITDPDNSPWPEDFYWVAADNSHVPVDAPATYAFGRAVAGYVSRCILRLRAIKDAIDAAADQAALDAINVASGYPAAGS